MSTSFAGFGIFRIFSIFSIFKILSLEKKPPKKFFCENEKKREKKYSQKKFRQKRNQTKDSKMKIEPWLVMKLPEKHLLSKNIGKILIELSEFLDSQILDFAVGVYGFWVAPHSEPCSSQLYFQVLNRLKILC